MDWLTPTNKKSVERFTATVNYLSQFFPELASHMAPISELTRNKPFNWTDNCNTTFNKVKQLADQAPILTPLNMKKDEPVYLFIDASLVGTGSWIGQGPTIYTARPAAFHSRKFTEQQTRYATHKQELLALVDALRFFEPQLLGYKFTVVIDNRSLQYLYIKSTIKITPRQYRWLDEISKFDFDIIHIEGKKNIIADALSRLSETKTNI